MIVLLLLDCRRENFALPRSSDSKGMDTSHGSPSELVHNAITSRSLCRDDHLLAIGHLIVAEYELGVPHSLLHCQSPTSCNVTHTQVCFVIHWQFQMGHSASLQLACMLRLRSTKQSFKDTFVSSYL
jgi:hypothetical protein